MKGDFKIFPRNLKALLSNLYPNYYIQIYNSFKFSKVAQCYNSDKCVK